MHLLQALDDVKCDSAREKASTYSVLYFSVKMKFISYTSNTKIVLINIWYMY